MDSVLADLDNKVDQHLASKPAHPQQGLPHDGGGAGPQGKSSSQSPSPASAPHGPPGADRPAEALGIGGGVASNWWNGLRGSVQNLVNPQPPAKPQSKAQQAVATARRAQAVVSSLMGALSVPGDLLNTGFANLT